MLPRNDNLLSLCHDAWTAAAMFRYRRRRFKDFTYGRQWADRYRTPEGRVMTEREAFEEAGRVPVTNNLIRQTVKNVIGRYRRMRVEASDSASASRAAIAEAADGGEALERDCRALEEFLISGCAIQRVGPLPGYSSREIINVSPERFFFQRFLRADAADCRLMGMLHDLPVMEVIHAFAPDDATAAEILAIYRNTEPRPLEFSDEAPDTDFYSPDLPDHVRVIEIWRKTATAFVWLHDRARAEYWLAESAEAADRIKARLTAEGDAADRFATETMPADMWVRTFMTPTGAVLSSSVRRERKPPFAVAMYPMIDGEVHSLVEDVIDQQKYINRLVSLLDDIIASSAKGVLLFPSDQLPEGFTWREVRRLWANPNGVLPYKRTQSGATPTQINTGGTSAGASEMLRLQLQLFDDISGAAGSLRGRSVATRGAEMLRAEMEAADISVLDMLGSFQNFISRRDRLSASMMRKPKSRS